MELRRQLGSSKYLIFINQFDLETVACVGYLVLGPDTHELHAPAHPVMVS